MKDTSENIYEPSTSGASNTINMTAMSFPEIKIATGGSAEDSFARELTREASYNLCNAVRLPACANVS